MNEFIGLYSLSKTLRFELKPQRKTLENINRNGLLEQDDRRAENYQKVKKLIDEYHKDFIEKSLFDFKLSSLAEYADLYRIDHRDEKQKNEFENIQKNLRKQISERFTKSEKYKRVFGKELIKEDLLEFVKTEEDKELVGEFKEFTTYFSGFHENRKNIYVADEKSTAIAYRLIHENLPKFIDNMAIFGKVANTDVKQHFLQLYSDFKEYLNVNEIADMFMLDYYSEALTQTQIDVYNAIIGGKTLEDGTKIQGLNEYINLYNQQQTDKKNRLPKLKPLYKQILSDRNTISFLPKEFENDNEVLESIEKCYQELKEQVFDKLKNLLQSLNNYDLYKIYLRNDLSLTDISQKMFGSWSAIKKAIERDFEQKNPQKKKEKNEKYDERKSKFVKSFDSFSIGYINDCLNLLDFEGEQNKNVENYFALLGRNPEEQLQNDLFAQIGEAYNDVCNLLNTPYPEDKNLAQDKDNVAKIKTLLDLLKELQFFVKPLLGKGDESEKDETFYGEFLPLWEKLDQITSLYNKVRNRMTRKPYTVEKIKLNFENSTLLAGWDLNKETDNTSVILRKGGLYYLGIMNKKFNKIFKEENIESEGECYEKMEYKLLPGANKMLPKVFFSKSRIDEFAPSKQLLENYKNETHKKGANFSLQDCHDLIDFFKSSIQKHEDWKQFGFDFSDTDTYEDLSGFYREVEQQGYKITFRNISESYINRLVDEGKLYLFQIYNKDFSSFSKGAPNMHTLYWKMLFDEQNLQDVVYKLNGEAEVFFRKSSLNVKDPTHPKNQPIDNKNVLSDKKQSTFSYDLVKDRRYTVDKFQFHVPITMNFKALGEDNINLRTNEYIKSGGIKHIIGIDRGERHLLYLTVIDLQGNIKEQFSLNEIVNKYKGNTYRTDYHSLLDNREGERTKARQDWATIENIKDLKQGYLSQVIHKISQLILKYNAIVVLEDLNFGFMRGRQKFEKSVYQQFEKMLIDKLNYLVDKQANIADFGSVLKALQLANKFVSFQKLGKQSGFLFYVRAWNTSKIDPTTGFVNLFDTHYESIDKSRELFGKFNTIKYNAEKQWFEFDVKDYTKFNAKAEDTRQNWTICTYGKRIKTFRNPAKNNEWDNEEVDLTHEFKALFARYNIELDDNLQKSICEQSDKAFYEEMLHLFALTLQMRNSITGTENDYLISPVANNIGQFYSSEVEKDKGKDDKGIWKSTLPVDADANGAYNIARKGLWVIEQIKQTEDLKKLKLAISNKEWLQFAQKQNINVK